MKKIISLIFILVFALGIVSPHVQAASYKDVPSTNIFYKEIQFLLNKGIISSSSDGTFKPNKQVTRAVAVTMIGKAINLDGTPRDTNFTDVTRSSIASGYIQSAVDKGIIQGFQDGTFKPNQYVTRGQVAILLAKAFNLKEITKISFTDVPKSSAAFPYVGKIVNAKITEGYANNIYKPGLVVTRGQFSAFLARALNPAFLKNDADKLKTVGANNQLILVTTKGYGTSKAQIQTFERNSKGGWVKVLSTSGFIGKNGFATKKVEGDGKSPRGKYSIGTAFGQKGNPGTRLPFKNITNDDVWVDDPKSSLYNTWQSKKAIQGKWKSAEKMAIPSYVYGFVINYNVRRVPGAGSAIFFHVATGHTLGCTGASQKNMVDILKWIDPAKKPVIIQTPVNELSKY